MFRIDRIHVHITDSIVLRANFAPGEPLEATEMPGELERQQEEAFSLTEEQLRQFEAMGDEILKQASDEAARMLERAAAEASEMKHSARELGYSEGLAKAERDVQAQRREDAASLRYIIRQLEQSREDMFSDLEDEIIELCMAVIRKIAGDDWAADRSALRAAMLTTMRGMELEGRITIQVSDSEYERFFSEGSADFVIDGENITATLLPDKNLGPGGIVVTTENETVDASIGKQLRSIELAFRNKHGND